MELMREKESLGLKNTNDKWYSRFAKTVLLIGDLSIINLIFITLNSINSSFYNSQNLYDYNYSLITIINLSWIGVAIFNDIYRIDGLTKLSTIFLKLLLSFLLHSLLVYLYVLSNNFSSNLLFFGLFYVVAFISVSSLRLMTILLYKKYKNSGEHIKNVVIVGSFKESTTLFNFIIKNKNLGYRFKCFFDDSLPEDPHLGKWQVKSIDEIKEYCIKEKVDEIYFTKSLENKDLINDLSDFADSKFIYFRIVPNFKGLVKRDLSLYFYDSIPVLTLREEPLRILVNKLIKRLFDIAFSLAVILLIFPFILPIIALLIKLESKGPVFFKQSRPGLKNQLFYCYKFRTMRVNNKTELQATKDDPRITRFGRIMRKTSIDELPQFFNVLIGDMSIVGPRPNMVNQLEFYSQHINKYSVRHFIKPGITGYAQINGYRGETKEMSLMEKRIEFDLKYIEKWSLTLDCKIIILTVWNMLKGEKNAY